MLCCLTGGEEKRDKNHTPDEDDLTFVQTDSRKTRSATKQTPQRQVADVEPDNVANRIRKPTFMSRIRPSTSFNDRRRGESNKPLKGRQKRAPPASTPYVCVFCKKENVQRTNHHRHMVMKHRCRIDGTPATPADIEQAQAWSSSTRAKSKYKSKEFLSTDSDDDSTPAPSSPSPPRHRQKRSRRESSESSPQRRKSPGRAGHTCSECGKEFTQRTDMTRHLDMVHRTNKDGTAVTPETLAKLPKYNDHTYSLAAKAPKSRKFLSDTSSSSSCPTPPRHISKKGKD